MIHVLNKSNVNVHYVLNAVILSCLQNNTKPNGLVNAKTAIVHECIICSLR